MRWWLAAIGIFLSLGVLVAATSLYQMSLSGTMKKLGLYGSDFTSAVSRDKLSELGIQVKTGWECGLPSRIKGALGFMLSGDAEQGQLSFRLGEMRVQCGAGMIQDGRVEEGTYEVAKGLGYLESGYDYVLERGMVDMRVCEGLPGANTDEVMAALLSSTSGRVHELLYNEWTRLLAQSEEVEQICLDVRESRR